MEENDQVEGRNAVMELIESKKDINKIFVATGERHGSITKIIAKAKERGIVISEVPKSTLDKMSETHNHQGIIATVPPFSVGQAGEGRAFSGRFPWRAPWPPAALSARFS